MLKRAGTHTQSLVPMCIFEGRVQKRAEGGDYEFYLFVSLLQNVGETWPPRKAEKETPCRGSKAVGLGSLDVVSTAHSPPFRPSSLSPIPNEGEGV